MPKQPRRLAWPHVVGGIYWCGYWSHWYVVTDLRYSDGTWIITVYSPEADGRQPQRTHMTAWDWRRDEILWEPSF